MFLIDYFWTAVREDRSHTGFVWDNNENKPDPYNGSNWGTDLGDEVDYYQCAFVQSAKPDVISLWGARCQDALFVLCQALAF